MAAAKKQAKVEEVVVDSGTVTVVAKHDRFIDLVNNVEITKEPKVVEMHPWLQAQVDAGLVIVVA